MKHNFVKRADGTIDNFAYDGDTHNGPRCLRCDESWCEHCESAYKGIDIYGQECPVEQEELPLEIAK